METPYEISLREEYLAHERTRLREAWGELLRRFPWEWFVTLTFVCDVSEERAIKRFKVWISQLNRHVYGHRWHTREPFGVSWACAIEWQKSGRIHLHPLVMGVRGARRLDWLDKWPDPESDPRGIAGYARVYPIENPNAVSRYLTKYVGKGGEILLSPNLKDFSGDLVSQAAGHRTDP